MTTTTTTEQDTFAEWMGRLVGGDQRAAAELVREFEPVLLRTIRARLGHFRLASVVDPRDVSQAVFGAFFQRASSAAGLAIRSRGHLEALLATMARNKTHDEARRYLANRRDSRLVRPLPHDQLSHLESSEPTPSKVVAGHELVEQMWQRFDDDERDLLEQRAMGRDWDTIARGRGGVSDKLRKKLNRAIHRVLRELRIET
jgi:DNA-directed RNA polymerase specialized sigma24 family protein